MENACVHKHKDVHRQAHMCPEMQIHHVNVVTLQKFRQSSKALQVVLKKEQNADSSNRKLRDDNRN